MCPGCKTKHEDKVEISKPQAVYIFLSWTISVFVILLLAGSSVLLAQMFLKAPHTIWNIACLGWFQRCNVELCVNMGNDLEMPINYRTCNPVDSANKFMGRVCIFDSDLYELSKASIGYDFCLRENEDNNILTTSSGGYIFEDTFDIWKDSIYWNSTTPGTSSAKWAKIENGRVSNICGSNNILKTESRYNVSFDSRALTFSGVNFRYAETLSLDMSFGGRIDFYLKMAPILSSESESLCKTSFDGDIYLSYSIDEGLSWVVFARFPVLNYRNKSFTNIITPLPIEARTNKTRFKWEQPHFDTVRDFWALDDVRIFRRFPPNWRTTKSFEDKALARSVEVQRVQCCLDTDQCHSFPNTDSYRSGNHCEQDYLETSDHRYRLKKVDIIILLSSLLSIIRYIYGKVIDKLIRLTEMNAEIDILSTPRTTFVMEGRRSWKMFAFAIISFPFMFCSIILLTVFIHASANAQIPSNATLLSVTAITLDFFTMQWLLDNVFHCWPFHICPHIFVDSFPDSKIHYIGFKRLFTSKDITGLVQVSSYGCWVLFLLVMISSTPVASLSVLLRPFIKSNEIYHFSLFLVGGCTLARAVLGPTWVLKISFSLRWLLSYKSEYRKNMALSLQQAAKVPLIEYSALIATVVFAIITRINGTSLKTGYLFLIIGAVTVIAAFIGLTLGLLQGLPISPEIHLTTWPEAGCAIIYRNDCNLPCILTCSHCNRLHTCSMLYFVQMKGDEYQSWVCDDYEI